MKKLIEYKVFFSNDYAKNLAVLFSLKEDNIKFCMPHSNLETIIEQEYVLYCCGFEVSKDGVFLYTNHEKNIFKIIEVPEISIDNFNLENKSFIDFIESKQLSLKKILLLKENLESVNPLFITENDIKSIDLLNEKLLKIN